MVSTGMKFIKYVLFVFNFIFYLAGLALIIAGTLVQTKFQDYFVFFGGKFNGAAILLIAVGLIVFIIGFFGCCGAYKENHCMIMTFSVFLGIVLVLEVAAAIAAHVLHKELKQMIREHMSDAIPKYNQEKVKHVWDKTQEKLYCCGSTNYTEWSGNEFFGNTSSVPDSCCKTVHSGCGVGMLDVSNPDSIYTEGCADKLIKWAENNIAIIAGVAVSLAFVQVVGIIIACCLAAAIRKDYQPL